MASDQGVPPGTAPGTGTRAEGGTGTGAEGATATGAEDAPATGGGDEDMTGGGEQLAVRGEQAAVRGDMSRLRRPALLLIAGLAGLSYAWALSRDRLSPTTRPRYAACR